MGPKDDCESWFHLLLDLILVGGLPWKKLKERNEVLLAKEECRKEKRHTLYTGLKNSVVLNIILIYIDSQAHQDRVSYQFIYETLKEACNLAALDIDAPYDWENPLETSRKSPKDQTTQTDSMETSNAVKGNKKKKARNVRNVRAAADVMSGTLDRHKFLTSILAFMPCLQQTQKIEDLKRLAVQKDDDKSHLVEFSKKTSKLLINSLSWAVMKSVETSYLNRTKTVMEYNLRRLLTSFMDLLDEWGVDEGYEKREGFKSRDASLDKFKTFQQDEIEAAIEIAIKFF
ncbi:unnamed protein product [Caenorhabditis brenneri]